MKKLFKIVLGIVGAIVVLGIIGAVAGGHSDSSSSTASKSTTTVSAPAPTVSSPDDELKAMLKAAPAPKVTKDDVSMDVTYTLTNTTKDKFDYVELDIDFYNKAGVKIDSEMTNTQNVTPGQKFQLKVSTMESGASTYKVTGIYSDSLHD